MKYNRLSPKEKQISIPRKGDISIFKEWDKNLYYKSSDNSIESIEIINKKDGIYKISGLSDLKKFNNYTEYELDIIIVTSHELYFRIVKHKNITE